MRSRPRRRPSRSGAPAGPVASAVEAAGRQTIGAVVSTTVTVNPPVAVLPVASRAVHSTGVEPSGNAAPDAGLHVTVGFGSTRSVAPAVKVTGAPAGPVASTVTSAGGVTIGAVVSTTVTVNPPVAVLPVASRAVHSTGV